LAIVIDGGGSVQELVSPFANALASLAPDDLRPQYHFLMYATDCALVGSKANIVATAATLHAAVDAVTLYPRLHGERKKPACGSHRRLLDSVATALHRLSTLPGRRVLLLLSSGVDYSSKSTWDDNSRFAGQHGITIVGLDDVYNEQATSIGAVQPGHADSFQRVCADNGGVVLLSDAGNLAGNLHRMLDLLRSRYILEFPSGADRRTGIHNIGITIERKPALIVRTTGVTISAIDASILDDPNTVPSAPSQAVYGTKPPRNR
jgi:hypothetical protein